MASVTIPSRFSIPFSWEELRHFLFCFFFFYFFFFFLFFCFVSDTRTRAHAHARTHTRTHTGSQDITMFTQTVVNKILGDNLQIATEKRVGEMGGWKKSSTNTSQYVRREGKRDLGRVPLSPQFLFGTLFDYLQFIRCCLSSDKRHLPAPR